MNSDKPHEHPDDARRLTIDAKLIFGEAVELSPAERDSFVERACGGRGDLEVFVRRLLALHQEGGEFLESPTGGGSPAATPPSPGGATENPETGERVGSFELVRRIGEGAFGEVFLARQLEPVRRDVAVKLLRAGLDSRYVLNRFETERQALAMLDHPNIARMLDAGSAADGRPYFAMDLVRGTRITEHADANRLGVRERVLLLIGACRGVQHAHDAGLVHRDLKPANILVEVRDDRARARVIDFGIARAVRASVDATQQTLHGQVLGTPAYMGPEQARGGAEVDSRADVYSLGCVLYELLTGTTPIDAGELRGAADLARAIGDRTIPPPSERVTGMGDGLRTIARLRNAESTGLARLLRDELDWICQRALQRDAQSRYTSAGALADDLERWLDGRAVDAAPGKQPVRRAKRAAGRYAMRLRYPAIAMGVLLVGVIWAVGWVPGVPGFQELMQRSVEEYASGSRYGLPEGAWVNGMRTNRAGGRYALVGGGQDNRAASDHSMVGGGIGNIAGATATTIGGGQLNSALANYASISGGNSNTANSHFATIGGGRLNRASGQSSTVSGGESGSATGYASTIAGGILNEASGYASFAAGSSARAQDVGSFVWADKGSPRDRYADGDESQESQGARSFTVRALGGVHLFSQYGTRTLLKPGEGAWSHNLSDSVRTDREPVDGKTILSSLATLPIESFRYHQQDATLGDGSPVRHLGPSGEEFHAAFGLGTAGGNVTASDLDGVALAAIQLLLARVEQQEAALAAQADRLAELEQQVHKRP
ncbi:MAG: protein kinase [Planctomycetota bacterium]